MAHILTRRHLIAGLGAVFAAPAFAQRQQELEVPYVPTPPELVEQMLDLAGLTAADYLIDLGCGDGRIPVAAGRRGARALGVDLDSMRLQQAHESARRAGVQGRVSFRRQDLFATPIHEASVVALYLLPRINLALRPRLLTELAPGARIVSHAFDMGDWQPDATGELDHRRIFLWHVPAVAGGIWDVTLADGSYRLLELDQSFQTLSGTMSGNGSVIRVTGRLRGTAVSIAAEDGSVALSGRVEGDTIVATADPAWSAVRSG